MKSILIAVLSLFLFFGVALAEGEYPHPSIEYHINLGSGDGALLILGSDNNTIYLPENNKEEFFQVPNQVTFSGDKIRVVMMDTDIMDTFGVVTTYKKVVLVLDPDGWELIWWEQ